MSKNYVKNPAALSTAARKGKNGVVLENSSFLTPDFGFYFIGKIRFFWVIFETVF